MVAINPTADQTGRVIVLRNDRDAIYLPDEALAGLHAANEVERWRISPEISERRFRLHRDTCTGSFPVRRIGKAIKSRRAGSFDDYREKLRRVRLEMDSRRSNA